MKIKGLFLTIALGLVVSASGFLWLTSDASGPVHYKAFKPTDKPFLSGYEGEEEGEKGESYRGAARYLSLIRANPYTGEVSAAAVKKSIQQANNNPAYKQQSDHISWTNQGPDNIGGRTRAIVVDNQKSNVILAGGVSGGIWRSTNSGTSWSPIDYEGAEQYKSLAVVCMEQAANGDIYFGTGEQGFAFVGAFKRGFGGKTGHIGMGMWKSTDKGKTWEHLENTIPQAPMTGSSGTWRNVSELATDPDEPQRIFAATNRGVQLSEDGGKTWSRLNLGRASNAFFLEVTCSPDGNTVYAATSQRLYRSTDNGNTFELVNTSNQNVLPIGGGIGRIEVAIAPSDPDYVYLGIANTDGTMNGVFQSRNNGIDWQAIADGGGLLDPLADQGTWDNVIAVDPSRKDRIFFAGVSFWLWDGGGDFDGQGQWNQAATSNSSATNKRYLHVDHHEIVFNMDAEPPKMYIGNDGGLFRTRGDFRKQQKPFYEEINTGYNVTQFYAMDASARGDVIGGTQDNNTIIRQRNSLTGKSYEQMIGGDGFYCEISRLRKDVYIGESQNAGIERSQDAGQSTDELNSEDFDDISNKKRKSPFNTPFKLYENKRDTLSNDSIVYAANEEVVLDSGAVIDTVSNANLSYYRDDTANFKSASGNNAFKARYDLSKLPGQEITVLSKNGVEVDYTLKAGLKPLESVKIQDPVRTLFALGLRDEIWLTEDMLDFSQSTDWFKLADVNLNTPMTLDYTADGNTLYVGGWDGSVGRVYRITGLREVHFKEDNNFRAKLTAVQIATFPNVVTGVSVDPNDADRLLVTNGNYGTNNHVHYSDNAMDSSQNVTFEALDNKGPSSAHLPNMPAYNGLFRMDSANQIFVGTEMGVWFFDQDRPGQGWSEVNEGMARVPTHMLRQIKPAPWASGPRIYAATHGRGIYFTSSTNPNSGIDDWQANSDESFEPTLNVYPNPAQSYANVGYDIPAGAKGTFQLIDMRGNIVREQIVSGKTGEQEMEISVATLNQGSYILRMRGSSFNKMAKLSVAQ